MPVPPVFLVSHSIYNHLALLQQICFLTVSFQAAGCDLNSGVFQMRLMTFEPRKSLDLVWAQRRFSVFSVCTIGFPSFIYPLC